MKFRYLAADEVECRVSTVSDKGCSLLLYKDARCDQNILDETVGAMNWQRHHSRENANCIVSIWDVGKSQWVEKEDTGTESFTEKEKGLASDSFKRACFNWGIGRELYTAPFIWIKAGDVNLSDKNGKKTTYDKFRVSSMTVELGKIVALEIYNENLRKTVFSFRSTESSNSVRNSSVTVIENSKVSATKIAALKKKCVADGVDPSTICSKCNVENLEDLTEKQFSYVCGKWTEIFVNGK